MQPEPPYSHGTSPRIGVLLINLGTPDAPTPAAVRAYLREFLSDPRVVEIPRAIWLPILYLFVLTLRPRDSAHRYAQVWMSEGSPLKVHTERQATLLRGYLGERAPALPLTVDYAMRYGTPSIPDKLRALKAQHCDRILLVPLYPQYSASTTATAFDTAFRCVQGLRNQPSLRTVRSFHDHPGYIAALAQNVRDYWARNQRPDMLLISFHGVPRATLDKGDPYHCECHKTTRLLAERLGLEPDSYLTTFQSRFGREPWLLPYTDETLKSLAAQGCRSVQVICPGFASDCLETLEEIDMAYRKLFLQAGGQRFEYIEALNSDPAHIAMLARLVNDNLAGWKLQPFDGAATKARAIKLGAER